MSHHVSAGSSNPTGAVEVVRVQSSGATRAPLDGGGAAKPAVTQVAGNSGRAGANLPVEEIEQASNTIQNGRADLARTAGAERRLDGFDGVGGGGGGGGANNANANNADATVAAGTANKDVSQTGAGGIRQLGPAELDPTSQGTELV